MPSLGIFGLQIEKAMSYLKSAPSNLSNFKILLKKQKCLKLGPKMSYLGAWCNSGTRTPGPETPLKV